MASHGHLYEMFIDLPAASTFDSMELGSVGVRAGVASGAPTEAIIESMQVPNYTQLAEHASEDSHRTRRNLR